MMHFPPLLLRSFSRVRDAFPPPPQRACPIAARACDGVRSHPVPSVGGDPLPGDGCFVLPFGCRWRGTVEAGPSYKRSSRFAASPLLLTNSCRWSLSVFCHMARALGALLPSGRAETAVDTFPPSWGKRFNTCLSATLQLRAKSSLEAP